MNTFGRDAFNLQVLKQLRKHAGGLPGLLGFISDRSNGVPHHIGAPDVAGPAVREDVGDINTSTNERDEAELVARKHSGVNIKKVGVSRKSSRSIARCNQLRHKILPTEEQA
jgi:hypothetical protein